MDNIERHISMTIRDREGYIVDTIWIVGDDTRAISESENGELTDFGSLGEAINYYSEQGYQ